MPYSVEEAANEIIDHYTTRDISINHGCLLAVHKMDFVCNFKTLYHISRGQKPGKKTEKAIRTLYREIVENPKTKDDRPGAIRLDYPEGVDAHQARARIIEKLTPLDRYYALERAIDKNTPIK